MAILCRIQLQYSKTFFDEIFSLELLYGVQPNDFNFKYDEESNTNEADSIINRSIQIKKNVESKRLLAIENIENSQEQQKKTQNKRTNPAN